MEPAGVVSIICLTIIGSICTLGIFYQGYQENLLERIGASLIAIWAFARLEYKLSDPTPAEPIHLFLHVGLASLCIGLAYSLKKGELSKRIAGQQAVSNHYQGYIK